MAYEVESSQAVPTRIIARILGIEHQEVLDRLKSDYKLSDKNDWVDLERDEAIEFMLKQRDTGFPYAVDAMALKIAPVLVMRLIMKEGKSSIVDLMKEMIRLVLKDGWRAFAKPRKAG